MNDLIVITNQTTAAEVFDKKKLPLVIAAIEKEARSHVPDMTTRKGRDATRTIAAKVSKSKTFLETLGKGLGEDLRNKLGAINEQRNEIKDRLNVLRDEVRKPLTEFEEAEKARKATYHQKVEDIKKSGDRLFLLGMTSQEIKKKINFLINLVINDEWQEFEEIAEESRVRSIESSGYVLSEVENKEAEAVELQKLREESDARKRKDHEDKIASEAREKAESEAKDRREQEARKAEAEKETLRLEKEASEKRAADFKAREEQAKKDAIEADKKRIAAEKKAEEDKIQADKDAEVRRIQVEKDRIQAEKDAETKRVTDLEAARIKAEQDKIVAINEAREKSEAERIKKEKEANLEADRIAKDKKHNEIVLKELTECLHDYCGLDEGFTRAIFKEIRKGNVPRLSINY